MNTLISLLFLTLQFQSVPTAPSATFLPCTYFEIVDGPASNSELCCFTVATNPEMPIGITFVNEDGFYVQPEIISNEETGFFEVCMPLKFTSVMLQHPKIALPCIMENPCN